MAEQGFHLGQSQNLSQIIGPQMQQSLHLLQLPAMELAQLVREELSENPTLEDTQTEISLEDQNTGEDDFDKEFAELSQIDQEWRDYLAQSSPPSRESAEDEERRQFMMDSITVPESLQGKLSEQLSLTGSEPNIRVAAEALIGDIDDRGYFQTDLSELAMALGIPFDDLEEAKELIQGFEPTGVGATNLADCLLIQLQRSGEANSIAARVVENHLEDLARHRYSQIAKALKVAPELIDQAATRIASLEPQPGRAYSADASIYVTPDIRVFPDGDDFAIDMEEGHLPNLRISNLYKDLMAESDSSEEVRNYIRDKIRSGKFLIRSIHQRQNTIRRLAEEIVARQRDFFLHGASKLRPMKMADVATAIGVHETTISRAASGKYMTTPHGTFELRSFFNSGYETESGQSMSNVSVKNLIADLVKNEDSQSPLSDKKIEDILKERGISVARRTIAKYRDALNILPSHLRRTLS